MSASREVGVGIVGVGTMGRVHLGCLTSGIPGARLVALADMDDSAAEAPAREHGVPHFRSLSGLLGAPGLDAVVVATPAETHAEIVEAAANAGKHILCEKPFDCRLQPIDRALEAVERAGVALQIGFHRRFDRSFLRAWDDVTAMRVGEVVRIHIVSRDPVLEAPPRLIDGMSALFFDTTVHDFDMVRFLSGSEIAMVHVLASSAIHRQNRIDTVVMLVQMENGVVATIDNSQAVSGYDQRVEVFGTGGMLSVENEPESTVWVSDSAGTHAPSQPYFFAERYGQAYASQMRSFLESARRGLAASPSGADGRAGTAAALAAHRSVKEGRPVRIGEIG